MLMHFVLGYIMKPYNCCNRYVMDMALKIHNVGKEQWANIKEFFVRRKKTQIL